MSNNNHLDNDTTYEKGETRDSLLDSGDDRIYFVYNNLHTGVASLGVLRRSEPNRYPRRDVRLPATIKASTRASAKRIRDHAVIHQLGTCLTLTYAELPSDPQLDAKRFITKARTFYSQRLHYAVITEGGDIEGATRIHHNVLLPASPNMLKIAESWTHGNVFVGINPTDSDIRRMVNYVTKSFARSFGLGARYIKSRSKAPKPSKEIFNNIEDAKAALRATIPHNATGVST